MHDAWQSLLFFVGVFLKTCCLLLTQRFKIMGRKCLSHVTKALRSFTCYTANMHSYNRQKAANCHNFIRQLKVLVTYKQKYDASEFVVQKLLQYINMLKMFTDFLILPYCILPLEFLV